MWTLFLYLEDGVPTSYMDFFSTQKAGEELGGGTPSIPTNGPWWTPRQTGEPAEPGSVAQGCQPLEQKLLSPQHASSSPATMFLTPHAEGSPWTWQQLSLRDLLSASPQEMLSPPLFSSKFTSASGFLWAFGDSQARSSVRLYASAWQWAYEMCHLSYDIKMNYFHFILFLVDCAVFKGRGQSLPVLLRA